MGNFIRRRAALALLLFGLPTLAADPAKTSITVFAAASLTNALQELGDAFTKQSSIAVTFSFAASSVLARQIESGAPADIFFPADLEWMDYLQSRKLIQPATRGNLLGNRLVLIAPAASRMKLKIEPHFKLLAALGDGRLATGDPDSVPVGRYARQALSALGVWNEVADKLVRAENVRSALAFVARGEAPLGVVYSTDALIDKNVRVVDVFPPKTHLPIAYPIALTSNAKPDAAKFVEFLRGFVGRSAFEKYGFLTLR